MEPLPLFCPQVLTNFESDASVMFSDTKKWGEFYSNELELWSKLHTRIQRNIMAEFQLEMGIVHDKESWWVRVVGVKGQGVKVRVQSRKWSVW